MLEIRKLSRSTAIAIALTLINVSGARAFEENHFTCIVSNESREENTLYAGEFDVREGRLHLASSELRASLPQESRTSNVTSPNGGHYFEAPAYLMLTFRDGQLVEARFDDEPRTPQPAKASQFKVIWLTGGKVILRDEAPKYDGLRVRSALPLSAVRQLKQTFVVQVAFDGKPIGAAQFRPIDVERVLVKRTGELAGFDAMFEAQEPPGRKAEGGIARFCRATLPPSDRPPPPPPPPGE
jgi:hypothetical protein